MEAVSQPPINLPRILLRVIKRHATSMTCDAGTEAEIFWTRGPENLVPRFSMAQNSKKGCSPEDLTQTPHRKVIDDFPPWSARDMIK